MENTLSTIFWVTRYSDPLLKVMGEQEEGRREGDREMR
jgi:hypothetical protein